MIRCAVRERRRRRHSAHRQCRRQVLSLRRADGGVDGRVAVDERLRQVHPRRGRRHPAEDAAAAAAAVLRTR